jgi:hypothetical protein
MKTKQPAGPPMTLGNDSESGLSASDAAKSIQDAAPRLVKVAGEAAISWALWDGANRAILEESGLAIIGREIAAGYRNNCALLLAARLALLLDSDERMISFQTVYRHLKRPNVTEALIRRICAETRLPTSVARTANNIRESVARFFESYQALDWNDLHGRLTHFRNRGVAHLTPQEVEKRVTYDELRKLALSVTDLAECLEPFLPDDVVPVREEQITEYSDRALQMWRVSFATPQNFSNAEGESS